tara:strand:+ start:1379 stop:3232 length:1854 start_codon:yes stop_codon:yes gene_type:complete
MVKLVRLATNDEGVFTNSFGNNIILKPQSKIALLNLTFKITEQLYNIGIDANTGFSNQSLVFVDNVGQTGPNIYNLQELNNGSKEDFFNIVEDGLKLLLNDISNDGLPAGDELNRLQVYSSWKLENNTALVGFGTTQMTYKYATLCTVTGPTFLDNTTPQGTKNKRLFNFNENNMEVLSTYPATSVTLATGITRDDPGTEPKYWGGAMEDISLCDGTGIYMARIADYVDNGTGSEDNGFGIGLTVGDAELQSPAGNPKNLEATMDDDLRNFEIYFNREGETYTYIQDGAQGQGDMLDSNVVAEQGSRTTYPTLNDHDIMFFRITADPGPPSEQKEGGGTRGILVAGVWNIVAGVPTEHIIFSEPVPHDDDKNYKLYPYFYIRGAKADVKIDSLAMTPDPFLESNRNFVLTGKNDYALFDNLVYNNQALARVCPYIDLFRFTVDKQMQLTLHSDILRQLGFITLSNGPSSSGYVTLSRKIGKTLYDGSGGQVVFISEALSNGILSDNFTVLSDTLQMESYDASAVGYNLGPTISQTLRLSGMAKAGRRKNILMTIPVNDNANGIVEYDANTPIFIDMDNSDTINIKNMNFRVVDKFGKSIKTGGGLAIMTVLIQNGDE